MELISSEYRVDEGDIKVELNMGAEQAYINTEGSAGIWLSFNQVLELAQLIKAVTNVNE